MSEKYNVGAVNLAGSLGGATEAALSKGFVDATEAKPDPFLFQQREDENGNTFEGDRWNFRQTGACGRPNGNER